MPLIPRLSIAEAELVNVRLAFWLELSWSSSQGLGEWAADFVGVCKAALMWLLRLVLAWSTVVAPELAATHWPKSHVMWCHFIDPAHIVYMFCISPLFRDGKGGDPLYDTLSVLPQWKFGALRGHYRVWTPSLTIGKSDPPVAGQEFTPPMKFFSETTSVPIDKTRWSNHLYRSETGQFLNNFT